MYDEFTFFFFVSRGWLFLTCILLYSFLYVCCFFFRQEKEATKQEQKYSVLNHQVTQLQLDLEASRGGHQPTQTAGALKGEPKLQRLEDFDDIEHF